MGTILFDSVIFGPVKSRRLGVSLGINLLPNDAKLCNYNCAYCECGLTYQRSQGKKKFHKEEVVLKALEERLQAMKARNQIPNSITFAGNGEPTLHPGFQGIMEGVTGIRNKLAPQARVSVLSNGTMVHKDAVYKALQLADRTMLKLDTAIEETYRILNGPPAGFTLEKLMHNLARFRHSMIIQSLFLKGTAGGKMIDNTTPAELEAWLKAIAALSPAEVQVYTIARETPLETLEPASNATLKKIAAMVESQGIRASVYS